MLISSTTAARISALATDPSEPLAKPTTAKKPSIATNWQSMQRLEKQPYTHLVRSNSVHQKAYFNNGVSDAKPLVEEAYKLAFSGDPHNVDKACALIREAAEHLKKSFPRLANSFEIAAQGLQSPNGLTRGFAYMQLEFATAELRGL